MTIIQSKSCICNGKLLLKLNRLRQLKVEKCPGLGTVFTVMEQIRIMLTWPLEKGQHRSSRLDLTLEDGP